MDGWIDRQMGGRTDGWVIGWTDVKRDGWMNGWQTESSSTFEFPRPAAAAAACGGRCGGTQTNIRVDADYCETPCYQ